MIILIGNQKGGAGKSTFYPSPCQLPDPASAMQGDGNCWTNQQSVAEKYQRAKLLKNAEPYEVIAASLEASLPGFRCLMTIRKTWC